MYLMWYTLSMPYLVLVGSRTAGLKVMRHTQPEPFPRNDWLEEPDSGHAKLGVNVIQTQFRHIKHECVAKDVSHGTEAKWHASPCFLLRTFDLDLLN